MSIIQPQSNIPIVPKKPIFIKKPAPVPVSEDQMYEDASLAGKTNFGTKIHPQFLKAVRMQESSNKVDPTNYNLSMGFTPTAKEAIGKHYVEPKSLGDVVKNSTNYLAKRAVHIYPDKTTKDLSADPKDWGTFYAQKYVGVLPGGYRDFKDKNGKVIQRVSYQQIVDSFNKRLQEIQGSPQIQSGVASRSL